MMQEILEFKEPVLAIVHFTEDGLLAQQYGNRLIHFQALIEPETVRGEFIRFNHGESCELNGWIRMDSIQIDLVLSEEIEGVWTKKVA